MQYGDHSYPVAAPSGYQRDVLGELGISEQGYSQDDALALFSYLGLSVAYRRRNRKIEPVVTILPECKINPTPLMADPADYETVSWVANEDEARLAVMRNAHVNCAQLAAEWKSARDQADVLLAQAHEDEAQAKYEARKRQDAADEQAHKDRKAASIAAMARRDAIQTTLPDHLVIDISDVIWDVGSSQDFHDVVQREALDDDCSFDSAWRKVMGNIGYWMPGARRLVVNESASYLIGRDWQAGQSAKREGK